MGNLISSLENPGPVVGFLYQNEMGLLYWGFCLFKMAVSLGDFFLDLLFGYTITKGACTHDVCTVGKAISDQKKAPWICY